MRPEPHQPAPVGRSTTFAAFAAPHYRRVWAASLVSNTGDWIQITARAVLVFGLTGSTAALGGIYFFSYGPQLLFGLFGGMAADRFDRRRLLVACSVLRTAGAVVLGGLTATGTATFWNVAAVSFLVGVVNTILVPVQQAVVPRLAPPGALTSGVSLYQTTFSLARVVGPAAAGVLIPLLGLPWLFFLNAAASVVVVAAWLVTPVAEHRRPVDTRPVRAVVEGLRYVRHARGIAVALFVVAMMGGVGLVYQPLGVAFATDALSGGDADLGAFRFGLLQGAFGIGAIAGILGLTRWFDRRPVAVLVGTATCFSALALAFAASSSLPVALVLAVTMTAPQFANVTLAQSIVQHQAPEALRGRLLALNAIAWTGVFPVTSLVAGQLADVIGVRATIAGAALLCLLSAVPPLVWRRDLEPAPRRTPGSPAAGA